MSLPWLWFSGVEEVLEERPVVDHCLAQVFGGCLTALLADRDVVRRSVVLNDVRMVYGDVGGALLEVTDGVATNLHQIRDEVVGFDHGAFRVIDELRLVGPPRLGEPSAMFRGQWLDMELLHAFDTSVQLTFGMARVTVLAYEALVLGAELAAELLTPPLLHEHERNDDHCHRDQHAYDYSGVE